jgi:hypothetical protein
VPVSLHVRVHWVSYAGDEGALLADAQAETDAGAAGRVLPHTALRQRLVTQLMKSYADLCRVPSVVTTIGKKNRFTSSSLFEKRID